MLHLHFDVDISIMKLSNAKKYYMGIMNQIVFPGN